MKVLHIIDRLDVGGAERVFCELTDLLYKSRIDVSVLMFENQGSYYEKLNKDIPKVEYTRKGKFNFNSMSRLAAILKEYDIIHVHLRHVYKYVAFVKLFWRVSNKIILHDHYGKIHADLSTPFLFRVLKPKYYIGVSEELTSWAIKKLKVDNKCVFLLRNIVVKNGCEETYRKEGVVLVGNIKPVKNQLFAIEFIKDKNLNLTIIGQIHDKNYHEKIVKKIKELNLTKKVHFIHNQIDVQEILPKFQLGLMTSFSESGPLVLIEYMAQNLPFISFKTGEVVNSIGNDISDFIISNFKLTEWNQALNKLLEKNPKEFETLYEKYFNPKKYVAECINIYQNILGS